MQKDPRVIILDISEAHAGSQSRVQYSLVLKFLVSVVYGCYTGCWARMLEPTYPIKSGTS